LVTDPVRVTDDDRVFKALADPTRRFRLDLLSRATAARAPNSSPRWR
jgi:hypothetical protein